MIRTLLTCLAVALMLAACGSRQRPFLGRTASGAAPTRYERNALLRGASDLQCSAEELSVTSLGASGYRVVGCGRYVVYTCLLVPGGFGGTVACDPSSGGPLLVAAPPPAAVQPAAPTTPAPVQEIAAPQAQPTGPEVDAVRALISQRAPSILACSGDAALAVDATWDAAGALQVSLIGGRAGTAEEACVRAALADARVDPAGAGGHVLHPVQRP